MDDRKLPSIRDALLSAGIKPQKETEKGCKIICPFHMERTPSCDINYVDDVWYCFGCGDGGGVKYFMEKLNLFFSNAPIYKKDKKEVPISEIVIEAFDENPPKTHKDLGSPSETYDYKNSKGKIYLRVFRFELDDGKKEFRPLVKTKQGYRWKLPPKDMRGIYNADIVNTDTKAIVICEGEKATNAAQQMTPLDTVAICWVSGSKSYEPSLPRIIQITKGKKVILWADNDEAGKQAMLEVSEKIKPSALSITQFSMSHKEQGYDAADALKEGILWADLEAAMSVSSKETKAPPPKTKPAKAAKATPAPPPEKSQKIKSPPANSLVPICLGYDDQNYYVYSPTSAVVHRIGNKETQITQMLLSIAPLQFWEHKFPKPKNSRTGTFERSVAAAWIIQECNKRGLYDSEKVWGRGCTMDGKRQVCNLGDRILLDDNTLISIREQWGLENTYKISHAIPYDDGAKPLSTLEVNRFFNMIKKLAWDMEDSPVYLIGWLASALICGIIKWRSHCWVTGAAGSGKTFLIDKIVKSILSDFAIYVTSKTSEAGLRRTIGTDARPVIIDEAETMNREDRAAIQRIIELARMSSSPEGAHVTKASMSGEGTVTYTIRSSFIFASINYGIQQAADKSRFLHLRLSVQKAMGNEDFQNFNIELLKLMGDNFGVRFFKRAFNLAPQIKSTSVIFSGLLSGMTAGQRAGDTYGTILAAAYVILNGKACSDFEVAKDFINQHAKFDGKGVYRSSDKDDALIIDKMMLEFIKIDGKDYTIGDMIKDIQKHGHDASKSISRLRNLGLRMEERSTALGGGHILHIGKNPNLDRIFRGTSWEDTWFNTLSQHPLAEEKHVLKKSMSIGGKTYRTYITFVIENIENP